MPNAALNNITAPDAYAQQATLDTGGWVEHINIDVANSAIYWQIKQASRPTDTPGMATWQAEVFMPPGSKSLYRGGVTGIRFRAAVLAAQLPAGTAQAQVTVELVQ